MCDYSAGDGRSPNPIDHTAVCHMDVEINDLNEISFTTPKRTAQVFGFFGVERQKGLRWAESRRSVASERGRARIDKSWKSLLGGLLGCCHWSCVSRTESKGRGGDSERF